MYFKAKVTKKVRDTDFTPLLAAMTELHHAKSRSFVWVSYIAARDLSPWVTFLLLFPCH